MWNLKMSSYEVNRCEYFEEVQPYLGNLHKCYAMNTICLRHRRFSFNGFSSKLCCNYSRVATNFQIISY